MTMKKIWIRLAGFSVYCQTEFDYKYNSISGTELCNSLETVCRVFKTNNRITDFQYYMFRIHSRVWHKYVSFHCVNYDCRSLALFELGKQKTKKPKMTSQSTKHTEPCDVLQQVVKII